ncbi:DegT/DnrJ/EryC1/StrS family aminotransferase, partial [Achromobacter sp. Marseille-Q0513]|nr:DegT/DnrJ/EryC1/StrS family aminotransferase [Achromobacter sp. Marseille-Q0513]
AKMKHAAQVEKSDRRFHHVQIGVNSRLDVLQTAILLPKPEILNEELALRDQAAAGHAVAFQAVGTPTAVHNAIPLTVRGDLACLSPSAMVSPYRS